MKVNKAEFVVSAYSFHDYPRHELPEIGFSGKSNVGKSSLINSLINRKKLARTSSTPGRTQSLNFYNIDNQYYFVDFPGYGFARVPDEVRQEWQELINDYLYHRPQLMGIVQIVDARHQPGELDQMMVDWLLAAGLPFLLVATKVDKISRGERRNHRQQILNRLSLPEEVDFTFYSAKTGEGRSDVGRFIYNLLDK